MNQMSTWSVRTEKEEQPIIESHNKRGIGAPFKRKLNVVRAGRAVQTSWKKMHHRSRVVAVVVDDNKIPLLRRPATLDFPCGIWGRRNGAEGRETHSDLTEKVDDEVEHADRTVPIAEVIHVNTTLGSDGATENPHGRNNGTVSRVVRAYETYLACPRPWHLNTCIERFPVLFHPELTAEIEALDWTPRIHMVRQMIFR
jgi:hypothetical protein